MGLDGIEIFTNSSGSHHELRKLKRRADLIMEATLKVNFRRVPSRYASADGFSFGEQLGGVYLYSNQQGCDGDRLYYDGCALILVNGQVVAQGSQFSLQDVEVITATIDIEDVRSHRSWSSRSFQATVSENYKRVQVETALSTGKPEALIELDVSPKKEISYHLPEEEIACVSYFPPKTIGLRLWLINGWKNGTSLLDVGLS
jgi:NAD+ synthase (glutamine-hydrolysing)